MSASEQEKYKAEIMLRDDGIDVDIVDSDFDVDTVDDGSDVDDGSVVDIVDVVDVMNL